MPYTFLCEPCGEIFEKSELLRIHGRKHHFGKGQSCIVHLIIRRRILLVADSTLQRSRTRWDDGLPQNSRIHVDALKRKQCKICDRPQRSFLWYLDVFARFDFDGEKEQLLCSCDQPVLRKPTTTTIPIFNCGDSDMAKLRSLIWDGEELEEIRTMMFECKICFEEPDEVYSLRCGHLFCVL